MTRISGNQLSRSRTYGTSPTPATFRSVNALSKTPQEQLEAALWALEQRLRYCLEYYPSVSIPPVGTFLREGIQVYKMALGITQKQLAEDWGIRPSNLHKYLNGARRLQAPLAIKMGKTFGIAPELLLRVDLHHDLCNHTPAQVEVRYSKQALLKRYNEHTEGYSKQR